MKKIYGGATTKVDPKVTPIRKALPKIAPKPKSDIKIEVDFDDDECPVLNVYQSNFEFELNSQLNQLPYCCGVLELGEFEVRGNRTGISTIAKNKGFKEFFEELFRTNHGKTIIIHTIPNKDCEDLANYLAISPFFTKIKQFKNNGNGNLITIWISNK